MKTYLLRDQEDFRHNDPADAIAAAEFSNSIFSEVAERLPTGTVISSIQYMESGLVLQLDSYLLEISVDQTGAFHVSCTDGALKGGSRAEYQSALLRFESGIEFVWDRASAESSILGQRFERLYHGDGQLFLYVDSGLVTMIEKHQTVSGHWLVTYYPVP